MDFHIDRSTYGKAFCLIAEILCQLHININLFWITLEIDAILEIINCFVSAYKKSLMPSIAPADELFNQLAVYVFC